MFGFGREQYLISYKLSKLIFNLSKILLERAEYPSP